MARNILWVKWVDPLRPLLKAAQEYDFDEGESPVEIQKAKASFGGDYGDEEEVVPYGHNGGVGPALITKYGVFPFQEHMLPSKIFNFWVGHTDFKMTKADRNKINNIPGVEAYDEFTPVRFRIAIGKAFSQQEVKSQVEEAVSEVILPTPPPRTNVQDLINIAKRGQNQPCS